MPRARYTITNSSAGSRARFFPAANDVAASAKTCDADGYVLLFNVK